MRNTIFAGGSWRFILFFLVLAGCAAQVEQAPSPAAATKRALGCEGAALALDADAVVATVNGKEVLAKDLDPRFSEEEKTALRDYCTAVHKSRSTAVEGKINELLIDEKAKAAGLDVDGYVTKYLADNVVVSDAEAQAFFAANKSPDAPPYEAVKDQVVNMLREQKQREAFGSLIESVRKDATIVTSLPDVRPPANVIKLADMSASFGPETAAVTVVEFADFECPYCKKMADALTEVKKHFTAQGKVRFAFMHFPLSFHPHAKEASVYTACASEQGKFWPMHDTVFANMQALDATSLRGYAEKNGVDLVKLDACLTAETGKKRVEAEAAHGAELGVRGTPTLFINGRVYAGGQDPAAIIAAINAEMTTGK